MPPEKRAVVEERYRQTRKEWRSNNGARVKANKAAAYQKDKVGHRERGYAWRRDNPERLKELARGWQFRRRQLTSGGITATETAAWARRQKKVCHWCSASCSDAYDIDHITALSRGGPHETRNLCIACPSCNRRKNAKDPIDFAREMGRLL